MILPNWSLDGDLDPTSIKEQDGEGKGIMGARTQEGDEIRMED